MGRQFEGYRLSAMAIKAIPPAVPHTGNAAQLVADR
jgi:hypothetical protein